MACEVAILTPNGRGAIATIAAQGDRALELVDDCFHSDSSVELRDAPNGRILFGRWMHGERLGLQEEVVVVRRANNHLEIHCHGGPSAAESIIGLLVDRGATAIPQQNWNQRSGSSSYAEKVRSILPFAESERTAAILLDQMRGSLDREVSELGKRIDEQSFDEAERRCSRLLEASWAGIHLTSPWLVAVCGPPNVGKSSLINAILGFERSIVYSEPGTTRDRVTARSVLDGWPLKIFDTAGVRQTTEPIESQGIQLARETSEEADLVLWIVDIGRDAPAPTPSPRDLPAKSLLVGNKSDLTPLAKTQVDLTVSALTGDGISSLQSEMIRRLVPNPPTPGEAVPFLESTRKILQELHSALSRRDHATIDAVWKSLAKEAELVSP